MLIMLTMTMVAPFVVDIYLKNILIRLRCISGSVLVKDANKIVNGFLVLKFKLIERIMAEWLGSVHIFK